MKPYDRYDSLIHHVTDGSPITFAQLKGQVLEESSGIPTKVSSAACRGLMQLSRGAAMQVGGHDYDTQWANPEWNLKYGHEYMLWLMVTELGRFHMTPDDNWKCALSAYNGGVGYVLRALNLTGGTYSYPLMLAQLQVSEVRGKHADVGAVKNYVDRISLFSANIQAGLDPFTGK